MYVVLRQVRDVLTVDADFAGFNELVKVRWIVEDSVSCAVPERAMLLVREIS